MSLETLVCTLQLIELKQYNKYVNVIISSGFKEIPPALGIVFFSSLSIIAFKDFNQIVKKLIKAKICDSEIY